MSVKKAIIPCAGFGTRFLPVTKVLPKELLPIVDKPALSYIVEEAVASGIEEIMIVISPEKEDIKRLSCPMPHSTRTLKKLVTPGLSRLPTSLSMPRYRLSPKRL